MSHKIQETQRGYYINEGAMNKIRQSRDTINKINSKIKEREREREKRRSILR